MAWAIINMLTHMYPKLLEMSELYHQNNILLYASNQIRYLLFPTMYSHTSKLISCLEFLIKLGPAYPYTHVLLSTVPVNGSSVSVICLI